MNNETERPKLNLDKLEETLTQTARDLKKISDFNKLYDEIIQRDGKLF